MAVALAMAVVLAAGGARVAQAQEAPAKPESKPKPLLHGEQADMAKLCQLSQEQQKRIVRINAAMQAEQAALARKHRAEVLDVLTAEQKDTWQTDRLKRQLKQWYRQVEFSADQIAAIRAARAAGLEGVDPGDHKAAAKAQQELHAKIRNEILTGQQRATLEVPGILRRYRPAKMTGEQNEAVKAAYVKLAEGVDFGDRKAAGKFQQDLDAHIRDQVLTGQQRAAMNVPMMLGRYRAAKMTGEQNEAVKAAYVKLAEGKDLKDRKARHQFETDLRAQIEKDILTAAQKIDLAVAAVAGPYRPAKLSEDQIARIKAAYVKHMTGVQADDRKARHQALSKLHEEIKTEILTDQQREAIKPKPRPTKAE